MSAASKDGSPIKSGAKSQSPLAFTPTSVMRKMTADRDRHDRSDKPESPSIVGDLLKDSEKNRDQMEKRNAAMQLQNPLQQQQVLGRGKVDNKRDMRRGASPLPPGGPMMSGKGPMMMAGGGPGMMNMTPHNMGPPSQRHPSSSLQPPNLGLSRGNQQNLNNIRALQAAQAQAVLTQQLMRGQAPPADGGLHVPLMSMGGTSHRSSPVNNLLQFFNRDIMAQVQAGGLPELPGGKVLSLEEVERLQQTQAVPN